ncbi:MAG: 50S ribosomal protein L5 [Firmicutes bacterium]|nr:50S ribosomal protein L5 [Bacillota bacterium]
MATEKPKAVKEAVPNKPAEKAVTAKPEVAKKVATPKVSSVPRLKTKYANEVAPQLKKTFNYSSAMQIPRMEKIVLNMRMGDIKDNTKSMQLAMAELEKIAGQKAVITKAKKSVANFKIRENQNVGAMVTLRGARMWEFFDKLISIALPRVRDFRGISAKSFDGRGNYALGVKEQLIFPEIQYDQVEKVRGFDIAFVTTANTDEEARELLKLLGIPFAR